MVLLAAAAAVVVVVVMMVATRRSATMSFDNIIGVCILRDESGIELWVVRCVLGICEIGTLAVVCVLTMF
jgi:hypothetical protein